MLMKRYALLTAAAAVVPAAMLAGQVNLQDSTPGTQQKGHINVSGTVRAGSISGYSSQQTEIAYGGDFRTVSSAGRGVLGNASAPTGVTYGGLFQSFSTSGRGVAGITAATTGQTVGGFFTTNSVEGKGVQGSSNATSGQNFGVYGRNLSPIGFALYGEGHTSMTGNLGVGLGLTPASERLVVNGNALVSGTITGSGAGLTGLDGAAISTGIIDSARLGVDIPRLAAQNIFTGINRFGIVVAGEHSSPLLNGQIFSTTLGSGAHGVSVEGGIPFYGFVGGGNIAHWRLTDLGLVLNLNERDLQTISPNGNVNIGSGEISPSPLRVAADLGDNTPVIESNNGAGFTGGVLGRRAFAGSTGGPGTTVGVAGRAKSTDNNSIGVFGFAGGPSVNYGVYGDVQFGDLGYAGFFDGDLFGRDIYAMSKHFLIDHPLDPARKFLIHSCIESDERMNLYRGLVTTDSRGYATISLANWSEALNKDFLYQLTVIDPEDSDSFTLAKVVQEVKSGKFRIRTSAPHTKVSWLLTGVRHDPAANLKPLEVEREKTGAERGNYLAPEAYGKDASFGIGPRSEKGSIKPLPRARKVDVRAKK